MSCISTNSQFETSGSYIISLIIKELAGTDVNPETGTTECTVHPNYKAKVVSARDRSTVVTGHSLGHPVRTIKNQMSREMARLEKEAQISEEELIAFGTDRLRLAAEEGDMNHGSVMSGQVSGMIDDVVSCQVLIGRIVATAEERIAALRSICV